MKGTVAGVTTVYIAGLYEWQNGAVTKYYEGGAIRRTGYATDNGVFYVVSDHLRSTSVLVNRDGTVKSRNYYYPYGGNRGSAFSGITTKRFTGQYHEQGLPGGEGLSYYNARWYDAQVGAFISADTLVPSPLTPQTFNRYAYTRGNPLRYNDPTGHDVGCPGRDASACGGGRDQHYVYGAWQPTSKLWTWPSFPVPTSWLWSNGRFNAVAYTRSEIIRNVSSAKANEIRSLNGKYDAVSKAQANFKWAQMVRPGQEWDHKSRIITITKSLEPANRTGTWQQVGREEYRFDTWSNIHYGYVGRSAGFSTEWLLAGASLAQLGDDVLSNRRPQYNPQTGDFLNRFDDIPDQAAIALGARLWEEYGAKGTVPTQEQFMQALQVTPDLKRRPDQGGQP